MDLIDEVIGYAKANADAARTDDERQTWAAHHRNCVKVKAGIEDLRAEVALWKDRWEAERRDHEATMHHADEAINNPHF